MGTSCQGEPQAGGNRVRRPGLRAVQHHDLSVCSRCSLEPSLSPWKTRSPHLWCGSRPRTPGPRASRASLTDSRPGPGWGRGPSLLTRIFWTELQKQKRATAHPERSRLPHASSRGRRLPRVWPRRCHSEGPMNHLVQCCQTFSPCSHRGF